MKMEYIALAAIGVIFLIAIFQAIQLTSLNEKVSSQDKLIKLGLSGALASGSSTSTPAVSATTQTVSQPTSQPRQVGGC